jgi:hypothetical protein
MRRQFVHYVDIENMTGWRRSLGAAAWKFAWAVALSKNARDRAENTVMFVASSAGASISRSTSYASETSRERRSSSSFWIGILHPPVV